MQLSPGKDEPLLPARQRAGDELCFVDPVNSDTILIVGVKMWHMMTATYFGIHPDDDSEETSKLRHGSLPPAFELPRGFSRLYLLINGNVDSDLSRWQKLEQDSRLSLDRVMYRWQNRQTSLDRLLCAVHNTSFWLNHAFCECDLTRFWLDPVR